MKILHMETGRQWLGGPAQVLYLMRGLAARGHEVCLVTPSGSGLGTRAKEAGLDVRFVTFKADYDPRLFAGAMSAIAGFHPDIVHLHSRRGADTQGILAARLARKPVVLSRRVDYAIRPTALNRWRYNVAADQVVCISEAIRRVVLESGVPEDRVTTVHSAVDIHTFKPNPEVGLRVRSEMGVNEGDMLFATVAQLISRKGHETVWRAVQRLSADFPSLRVAVFGRGEEEDRLRALAVVLGIERHLLWMGFHERLHEVLPAIDCLAHPARLEGLGVAILQALACGKPVIACPVGGIPEAVRPPEDGWLVPVDDDAALAAAMREVMADPVDAAERGAAGRALMERSFSVDAMVEGNIAIYRKVLDARAEGLLAHR